MKANKLTLRKALIVFMSVLCVALTALAFTACGGNGDNSGNGGNGGNSGGEPALASGTYWATQDVEKPSMGNFTYVVHLTLDADAGTYYFGCYYVMGDATYFTSDTGTYTDNGTTAVFVKDGTTEQLSATIGEDSFTLSRKITSMGSAYELEYELGDAPVYITYTVDNEEVAKIGYRSGDEVVLIGFMTGEEFVPDVELPATATESVTITGSWAVEENEPALVSGTYWATQDVEKPSMGNFTYVVHLTLDADAGTYYFGCYYVMRGATYFTSDTGTYTDNGTTAVFVKDGTTEALSATIGEDSFTLSRKITSMGSAYELEYELGDAPVYITYTVDNEEVAKIGYRSGDEVVLVGFMTDAEFVPDGELPETATESVTITGSWATGSEDGEAAE